MRTRTRPPKPIVARPDAERGANRRAALIDLAMPWAAAHGLHAISLRPLGTAIGTSARMLVYHFGSKDGLVVALLERIASVWMSALSGLLARDASTDRALASFWADTLREPDHRPLHALAFEAWALGLASGHKRYRPFLDLVARGWIDLLERALRRERRMARRARARATLLVAATEGLLLHQLTDRRLPVDAAFGELVGWLRALRIDGDRP